MHTWNNRFRSALHKSQCRCILQGPGRGSTPTSPSSFLLMGVQNLISAANHQVEQTTKVTATLFAILSWTEKNFSPSRCSRLRGKWVELNTTLLLLLLDLCVAVMSALNIHVRCTRLSGVLTPPLKLGLVLKVLLLHGKSAFFSFFLLYWLFRKPILNLASRNLCTLLSMTLF